MGSTLPTAVSRAVDRRSVLRGAGAAIVGTSLLGGVASAGPSNENVTTTMGEGVDLVGGGGPDLWTETTYHEKAGKPTKISILLTGEGFEHLTASATPGGEHYHLDFPATDGLNYTFAGLDWNPMGHPPASVWDVPHFDFHYYFVPEPDVDAITGSPSPIPGIMGIADYELPEEQFPRRYVYETPRFIVERMGEHVFNERTPEIAPDVDFTHTYIYGVYDPSIDLSSPDGSVELAPGLEVPVYAGDGTGELRFTEPMITEAFLRSDKILEGGPVNVRVEAPEVFPQAGYYPTRYVISYSAADDTYEISLEGMKWFEAA